MLQLLEDLAHPERVLHQVVRLADQLHVAVVDPVVDHLDEVAAAVLHLAAGRRFAVASVLH